MGNNVFTKEQIEEIVNRFPKIGANMDSFEWDIDDNYYLSFDHPHNILIVELLCWEMRDADNILRTINKVKVALTGDWEEDVKFGIRKVLDI